MNNGLGMGFVFPLNVHMHIPSLPYACDDQLHVIPSFNGNEEDVR